MQFLNIGIKFTINVGIALITNKLSIHYYRAYLLQMTTLKQYVDWLNEIVGFFVVEDHIHLTEPSLVTAQHTENLWKNASTAVFDLLNSHFVSL